MVVQRKISLRTVFLFCTFLISPFAADGCSLLVAFECANEVQALLNELSSVEFPFTSTDLNNVCQSFSDILTCMANIGCNTQDLLTQLDDQTYLSAYKLGSYLCGSARDSIEANISCYVNVPDAVTAIQECNNQTQTVYSQLNSINPCGIAATEDICYMSVLSRCCSSDVTQLLGVVNNELATIKYPCNISETFGPCDLERLQACTASMVNYINTGLDSATFSMESLFWNTCGYVDWTSACLEAFGCGTSQLNSWLKYQPAMTSLCFDNSQSNMVSATFDVSSCSTIPPCSAIPGSSSTLISNCPNGFTINTTQSTTLPTSCSPPPAFSPPLFPVPSSSPVMPSTNLPGVFPTWLTNTGITRPTLLTNTGIMSSNPTLLTGLAGSKLTMLTSNAVSGTKPTDLSNTAMSGSAKPTGMRGGGGGIGSSNPTLLTNAGLIPTKPVGALNSNPVQASGASTWFPMTEMAGTKFPPRVQPSSSEVPFVQLNGYHGGLSSGDIVAIVICVVLGVCLLAVVVVFIVIFLRKRRAPKAPCSRKSSSVITADSSSVLGGLPPTKAHLEFQNGFNYATLLETDRGSSLRGPTAGQGQESQQGAVQPELKENEIKLSQQEEIYFNNGKSDQIV